MNRAKAKLQDLWNALWFLPALIVLGFAALAVAMVEISGVVSDEVLAHFPRLFGADAESSRAMLAAIASSIITVAGVTFSITVLVISQVSSQYTPRILRNFLRDRPSQVVLGVLVGAYVYCLMVMRTIRAEPDIVPSLAVLLGIVTGVIAVGFLVYFLHHIASSLEAGTIIARIRQETAEAVDRLFPAELGTEAEEGPASNAGQHSRMWKSIVSKKTGYLQRVDSEVLLKVACQKELLLRIECCVGDFVAEGAALLSVADTNPDERLSERVRGCFVIDTHRTIYQDAAFGIRQLVDMALKALSPGINDSTTAVTCVDHLGALLARLASRSIPSRCRAAEGQLRLIAPRPTFESFLDEAFEEIRRFGSNNVVVLARMLRALETIASAARSADRLALLKTHAERVLLVARTQIALAQDQSIVVQACERALRAIDVASRSTLTHRNFVT